VGIMERKARILQNVRSALRRSPHGDLQRPGIQVFFDGGVLSSWHPNPALGGGAGGSSARGTSPS
jgi:hypothetical protein